MKNIYKKIIIFLIFLITIIGGILLYNKVLYKYIESPITLNETNIVLNDGDLKLINYTLNYDDILEWSSSDNSVVSVYSGLLKANSVGNSIITVKGSNNKEQTINVTVDYRKINNIIFNESDLTLAVGETKTLNYTKEPYNGNENIIWSSSNESVVKVSNNNIEALSLGESTITAETTSGIKASINILVDTINVKQIILNETNIELYKGESYKVDYSIDPIDSTNSNLTWSTTDNNIVEVSDSTLKGINSGNAIIKVESFNGVYNNINVTVLDKDLIEFSNNNKTLFGTSNTIDIISNKNNITKIEIYKDNTLLETKDVNNNNYSLILDKIGYYELKIILDNNSEIIKNYSYSSLSDVNTAYNELNKNYKVENSDITYLAFGSDYQKKSVRKANLNGILTKLNSLNIKPNFMMYLGDYQPSTGSSGTKSGIKEITNMVHGYSNFNSTPILFLQGNHDPENHSYIVKTGGYDSYNFSLFAINREDHHGKESGDKAVSLKLDEYLNNLVLSKSTKPVYVVTHVPLHYSSRKDNKYSNYIIDVLNKYGDLLDIIVMYGHNENPGGYDDCIGGSMNYFSKGSTLTYYSGKSTTQGEIKFTYLNAGYVGYAGSKNTTKTCSGNKVTVYATLTMSLHTITDTEIKIQRVSKDEVIDVVTIKRNI